MADSFHRVKRGVLSHIHELFEELEEQMVMAHQEKYAMLEDAFENATDTDELRVAFEQWFTDHADDMDLEHSMDDIWEAGLAVAEEHDDEDDEDFDEDYDDADEENFDAEEQY